MLLVQELILAIALHVLEKLNNMKIFLYPNPEAPYNLVTVFPAYDDGAREVNFPGLLDDEFLQAVITQHQERGLIPSGSPIYIQEYEDLPPYDFFFEAWEWED